ncbi:hypothetical protein [Actinomadura sp. NTSP31]|uniref:hypothetical protein n=1 Tax=Actinomadura sp. NTSP31 TaxID=1735447 RepID=UPI0035BF6B9E
MSNEPEEFNPAAEPRLNPDAESFLAKSLDDVRQDIIRLAARSQAARPTPPSEVTVSEVKDALNELGLATAELDRPFRPGLISWFGISGLILVVVGAVLAAVSLNSWTTITATAISLIGASGAYWSIWTARRVLRRAEPADRAVDEVKVLQGWAALERAMKERIGELPEGRSSLSYVIQKYAETAQLSNDDMEELRSILRVRNEAAHSPIGFSTSNSTIQTALAALDRQLERVVEHITPQTFERVVLANLQIIFPQATTRSEPDFDVDAYLHLSKAMTVGIVVKYHRQELNSSTLRKWVAGFGDRIFPVLVITNGKLPQGEAFVAVDSEDTHACIASWRGSRDNPRLQMAIESLVQRYQGSVE